MHFLIVNTVSRSAAQCRCEITTFQNILYCYHCPSTPLSSSKGKSMRPRWDSNPQSPAPEADALSIRPLGHHRIRVLTPSPYAMPSSCPALAICGLASGGVRFGSHPRRRQRTPAPSCARGPDCRPIRRACAWSFPLPLPGLHGRVRAALCVLAGFLEGSLLWLHIRCI